MKFKKKIRCPYCDGKIIVDREEWLTRNSFNQNSIMIPRVVMPICASCGREFIVGIKTEGELEITLEG